jgi:ElaB/YqjD/DUF883 family membrane-anchored ribosome-binding protein
MEKQQLRETLAKLHGELGDQARIDDDTRALLKTLTDDINRLLSADAADSAKQVEPLSEQVQGLVRRFEADHPQLTASLNQVASALANMGI